MLAQIRKIKSENIPSLFGRESLIINAKDFYVQAFIEHIPSGVKTAVLYFYHAHNQDFS